MFSALKAAIGTLLYGIGWCVQAVIDLLVWFVHGLIWFVQWLPERLLGRTSESLPVGKDAAEGFKYLQDGAQTFFDWLSDSLQTIIDVILAALLRPPGTNWLSGRRFDPWYWSEQTHQLLVIALFVLLAFVLQRSWKIAALVLVGFLFIIDQGYYAATAQTLTLVLTACVVCMGVGVPIGIAAAHRPRLYQAIAPILDLMQTLPTFVYLIPVIGLFGLGMVPGLIATVVFVMPAPIRMAHLGITGTPPALIEAAQAFGGTKRQTLWKVELPSAYPQIMAGLTQTIMLSLSMVVIAGLVGANGLGVPVVRALNTVNTALGFESGLIIVVVAIMLDRMLRVTRK
ncbi:MAG: choline ABC transporter permease subunit [Rubellimicrobium sp.]|nr:choline ABC transporter permease subunit [Rubellimicrobium sp.]